MILCDIHPWEWVRQLWHRFVLRWGRAAAFQAGPARFQQFEKAELIEKYGFNRYL